MNKNLFIGIMSLILIFTFMTSCIYDPDVDENNTATQGGGNGNNKITALSVVLDEAKDGDVIDLSQYNNMVYDDATISKSVTITEAYNLSSAKLTIVADGVTLKGVNNASVTTNSSMKISGSTLNSLSISAVSSSSLKNAIVSRGDTTSDYLPPPKVEINGSTINTMDVAIENAFLQIEDVKTNEITMSAKDTQLTIQDKKTEVAKISFSKPCQVVLEDGTSDTIAAPKADNNADTSAAVTQIDMIAGKNRQLMHLSVSSGMPTVVEYGKLPDFSSLIVIGTYSVGEGVTIYKSGDISYELTDSFTKLESNFIVSIDSKEYYKNGEFILTDTLKAGKHSVVISSDYTNKANNYECSFDIMVKSEEKPDDTASAEPLEEPVLNGISVDDDNVKAVLKNDYAVGEKLSLKGLIVLGNYSYNGINYKAVVTGWDSMPADGKILSNEDTGSLTITYQNKTEVINNAITVSTSHSVIIVIDESNDDAKLVQNVLNNTTVNEPKNPTKPNCSFAGWVIRDANNHESLFDWNTPITADTTVYAKWHEIGEEPDDDTTDDSSLSSSSSSADETAGSSSSSDDNSSSAASSASASDDSSSSSSSDSSLSSSGYDDSSSSSSSSIGDDSSSSSSLSSGDDSSSSSSSSLEDDSTSSSSSDSSSSDDSSSSSSSSSNGDDSSSSSTTPSNQTCATPVISGTTPFESSTIVSISCETTGANIYYTTDGSAPTTSSTLYIGSFNISATTTVKAIAVKSEYNDSEISVKTFTNSTTTTTIVPYTNGVTIYVKANSAPTIWVWQRDGSASYACSELMGYTWDTQPTMTAATGMNDNTGWYMTNIPSANMLNGMPFAFKLNRGGADITTTKTTTFWYDNGIFYDSDPTIIPDPVKPTVIVSPNSGSTVKTTGSIKVTFTDGYDTITNTNVTINGQSFNMGTTAGTWSRSLADLGITEDDIVITVSVSVTNSIGTTTVNASYTSKYVDPSQEDTFTWDNVNAYFVMTDRFYNGNTSNDHSYGRQNGLSGSENAATFHGGDLVGLTMKMDYFKNLGINAIWITAPYEQIHGWVGGKDGVFPHYAFHGYYTLDWTALDANMGTLEEFRAFVTACHANGIRVIMDVVMNHVGYNNVADMVTYNHGYTPHEATWLAKTDGAWNANDGVLWDNSYWDSSWFGPWIRSFGYNSGSEYGGSSGGLPDVKTELTSSVGLAPVHVTKWGQDSSETKSNYYNPSVSNVDWNGWSGDFRTDKNVAPAIYQEVWLSAWVREFGIDGFRCDTAKHVEPFRWGELKRACQAALEAWRNDDNKVDDTGAKDWDENFWMAGEYENWTSISGSGDYYTTGGFDSMINFSFNDTSGSGTSSNYPSQSTWSSYLSINNNVDSDNNGNRNNVLTYISSHNTKLCRASNQKEVGTMLLLTPGGVQIYYGDETNRPLVYTDCGDTDMMTRGDFNWDDANGDLTNHWGIIGKFRKFNPAVGAGTGTATKRSYSGVDCESKIAIGISGTTVDVSGLWDDSTTVYNWYDGQSAIVSGGSVTFAGGTMEQPILVSDKNPANYQ